MTFSRSLNTKEHTKLTNQSLVFEVFGEDEKLRISEITERVNVKLEAAEKLSDQTVRRAVKELCISGLLKPFGRAGNAQTFGKLSASFAISGDEKLVPFGGELVSVIDFVRIMTDPDLRPLQLKAPLLSEKRQHAIRRMLLFAIISSSSTGYNAKLQEVAGRLYELIDELEFLTTAIKSFIDSPIWYEQYRDKVGASMRKLIEEDPELYELAVGYMKSEG